MAHYRIITGDNCKYCDLAKHLLKQPGITFEEVHILDAPPQEMKQTNGKVPQIWHILSENDRVHVGGYNELTGYLNLR
jgi:glutaredoxin